MQKIIIHNFRQISDAEIDIKRILVFIGEQASGKSTIAKLIYFFKSLAQDYVDIVFNDGRSLDMNKFQSSLIKKIQNKFSVYFGFTTQLPQDFRIDFYYSYENDRKLSLSKARSLQIKFSSAFWDFISQKTNTGLQRFKNTERISSGVRFTIKEKQRSALLDKITKMSQEIFETNKECLFIPAGRNITVSYPEQFQLLFFGALSDSSNSIKEINTIDLRLIKDFMSYSKFLVDYFSNTNSNVSESKMSKYVLDRVHSILHGN